MARSKYPGVSLAAVKKFCRHCIKVNGGQNRRYRLEYAGLAEANGNYYLVDGFRLVRFLYDLPELIHAEKKEIGSHPSMLHFIENARQKCGTADIELPDLEEVKTAAAMSKGAKKRKKKELPFPLAGGRIWVNPAYLLIMMQIFPIQRVAVMTGNAYQPLYFSCDGADGILLPMRCDNPVQTMAHWEDRKTWAQEENAKASVPADDDDFSDIDTVAVHNALEAGGESDFVQQVKKDVAT